VPKTKAEFSVKLNKISIGDVVVHEDYGIGKFVGLQKIAVGGIQQECLKIKYKDEDSLYLNVDKLHYLEKFSGQEGITPVLSKLGTAEWEKAKQKTKKSIKNIAKDLIKLYAERKKRKGIEFSSDSVWQHEMEASFVYEETEDQLTATKQVKTDMENSEPMDRLLCGDVGFGKTEVAVRASFKVVNNGKQVAVLVPTTILAEQHYKTFTDRLGYYPVDVAVLSRFKTRTEQKKTVELLKTGKIDIVIGTHRLISKDIEFKDLGLLIIDEEQRFGVRHKEKLKMLKKEVDILSMTATPIPRTLHLSLMGVRDFSTINTPPKNRLPIITEIIKFDEELVRDAIYREVDRGGQVYFVHNRVQTIEKAADRLRQIAPGIKFEVAHGQLDERKLEDIMFRFLKKEFDVLVCTMIIEAGLDIANVNTILIDRADKFGLAQLYQLRGRVGRSDTQAYAYLIIPGWKSLTNEAVKRLKTISEHTELGAGFQIAMNDLEIRGAGNVFGAEQSGFVNSIGYEMYQKILDQAVSELKAEIIPEYRDERLIDKLREIKLDIDIEAFFPEYYIENKEERVNIYKRLSDLTRIDRISNIEVELIDRFGKIPEEGINLLILLKIKLLAQKLNISYLKFDNNKIFIKFFFNNDEKLGNRKFIEQTASGFTEHCKCPFVFTQEKGLGVKLDVTKGTKTEIIGEIKELLEKIYAEVNNEKPDTH
jgi:transcription-repair coupling factor (superfamily II helicase)